MTYKLEIYLRNGKIIIIIYISNKEKVAPVDVDSKRSILIRCVVIDALTKFVSTIFEGVDR